MKPLLTRNQPQRLLGGFLGLFVLLVLALPDVAVALTLTWDPNSEADVKGYQVYVGTSSGEYGALTDVGNATTYEPQGLQPNTTYFFAVTAYNSGAESEFSSEVSTTTEPSSEGGGGGGGGCFIASAAYGSNLAGEVQVLRRFRDRYLLSHVPGQLFVLLYYHLSPPLAHAIEGNEALRTVTRGALWPVVWWADLALVSPGVAFGMGAVGLLAAPIVAFILVRDRRCRGQPGSHHR